MKKIIKFIMLVMVMIVGVFGLASCGENYSKYVECDKELAKHFIHTINFGEVKDNYRIMLFQIRIDTDNVKEAVAAEVSDELGEKPKIVKLKRPNLIDCEFPDDKKIVYYVPTEEILGAGKHISKVYFIDLEGNKLFCDPKITGLLHAGKEPNKCQ